MTDTRYTPIPTPEWVKDIFEDNPSINSLSTSEGHYTRFEDDGTFLGVDAKYFKLKMERVEGNS